MVGPQSPQAQSCNLVLNVLKNEMRVKQRVDTSALMCVVSRSTGLCLASIAKRQKRPGDKISLTSGVVGSLYFMAAVRRLPASPALYAARASVFTVAAVARAGP